MIHPTGLTKTHMARGFSDLCHVFSRKQCITSWLRYITLCYTGSRFFLPMEQSRTALLGCSMAIIYLNMQHTVRATTRNESMISCHLIGLRKTKTLLRPQKD